VEERPTAGVVRSQQPAEKRPKRTRRAKKHKPAATAQAAASQPETLSKRPRRAAQARRGAAGGADAEPAAAAAAAAAAAVIELSDDDEVWQPDAEHHSDDHVDDGGGRSAERRKTKRVAKTGEGASTRKAAGAARGAKGGDGTDYCPSTVLSLFRAHAQAQAATEEGDSEAAAGCRHDALSLPQLRRVVANVTSNNPGRFPDSDLEAMFQLFDTDGDGWLTAADFSVILQKAGLGGAGGAGRLRRQQQARHSP
jgi:hypothetical protein